MTISTSLKNLLRALNLPSFVLILSPILLYSFSANAQEASEPKSLNRSLKSSEPLVDPDSENKEVEERGWIPLLPEKGLEGWEVTDFGNPGKVTREGELVVIEAGEPLNGITYKKKGFPKTNFEIQLEAQRVEGNDFLCGLTFPVGKEFCSLIAGGWGGGLVGLSSVDGSDASENATTTYYEFKNNQWYKFKIRVDQEYVRAWIDGQEFFRQEREDHEFSTRIEVAPSEPLGFCSYMSKVHLKDLKWRPTRVADKLAERAAKKNRKQQSDGVGAAQTPIK
jgi:hypothetical protein